MKKQLKAESQRLFYVSNIAGVVILMALAIWFFSLAYDDGSMRFASVFFWIGIVFLAFIPFALIGIFSSMKDVVLTDNEVIISYVFQRHKNHISFSEISAVKSTKGKPNSTSLGDRFLLKLKDGRSFEIRRSQFSNYEKLLNALQKRIK